MQWPNETRVAVNKRFEMTRFRPCIDLHAGQVKQIVGGTLHDKSDDTLVTNFISLYVFCLSLTLTPRHRASYYAQMYKDNNLAGGHVIMLGPGNTDAAKSALETWPSMIISSYNFLSKVACRLVVELIRWMLKSGWMPVQRRLSSQVACFQTMPSWTWMFCGCWQRKSVNDTWSLIWGQLDQKGVSKLQLSKKR